MITRFVDEVRMEFHQAIVYYESFQVGLGKQFYNEVDRW